MTSMSLNLGITAVILILSFVLVADLEADTFRGLGDVQVGLFEYNDVPCYELAEVLNEGKYKKEDFKAITELVGPADVSGECSAFAKENDARPKIQTVHSAETRETGASCCIVLGDGPSVEAPPPVNQGGAPGPVTEPSNPDGPAQPVAS